MADLTDQLRERAERAERERDYLRDMGRAYQETEAALRAERDEARDALRALRHGLGQDDGPRRAAIAEADRVLAAWGAQTPGPLADMRLSRDAWQDRAVAAERERDQRDRALWTTLDAVRGALGEHATTGDLAADVAAVVERLRRHVDFVDDVTESLGSDYDAEDGDTCGSTIERIIVERDTLRTELDAVREALETVREDGETCAAAVARLREESDAAHALVMRQGVEVERLRAEVERLRADRDTAEARGYRRGLEAAAKRLEARATSEQITADRLAPEYGEHGPMTLRHVCMAMVLRDEASRIRALTPEVAPEQSAVEPAHAGHSVGDEWRHEDGREARVCAVSTGLCGCETLTLRTPGAREAAARGTLETLERGGWRRVRCAEEVGRDE